MFRLYPRRMANRVEPPRGGSADAMGISVYVLRDPRDGVVFLVGRTSGTDSGRAENVDGMGSSRANARARERAIRDEGYDIERLIVASDLASDADAVTVERAIIAAYDAAQLMPTSLVGARAQPGRGSSAGALLGGDPFDDPSVREFVAQAASEIDRLSSALGRAEQELADTASRGFLDADHRGRLESVILQQESEMAQLNAVLDRVRALRDLGQWAAVTAHTGGDKGGTIRIADLTRALDSHRIDDASA